MSETSIKRKNRSDGPRDGPLTKRRQGGTGGKWQTPHEKAKSVLPQRGGKIEPGDQGIWITCVRGKEGKATEEARSFFEDYAERLYGIAAPKESASDETTDPDEPESIEDTIQKELVSANDKVGVDGSTKVLEAVFIEVQCVLFFKTFAPLVPAQFVTTICEDAVAGSGRRCRFINRMTPISRTGKATERGLEEVGKEVLGEHFVLACDEAAAAKQQSEPEDNVCSYAIRPTIRNHSTILKRDVTIKLVASLIDNRHKVNLSNPDKVILIEIYQNTCGMSVVDSSWETRFKRFNLFEIHQAAPNHQKQPNGAESTEQKPETGIEGGTVEEVGAESREV